MDGRQTVYTQKSSWGSLENVCVSVRARMCAFKTRVSGNVCKKLSAGGGGKAR